MANGIAATDAPCMIMHIRLHGERAHLPLRDRLPRDIASFTGRQAELARLLGAIEGLAADRGVVAIHAIDGMAGIGKTTFAVHAAHRLAASFPDGQFFLTLHAGCSAWTPAHPCRWCRSPCCARCRCSPTCPRPRSRAGPARSSRFALPDVPQAPWLRKSRGVRDGRHR